jgi:dienelactone hydrolase
MMAAPLRFVRPAAIAAALGLVSIRAASADELVRFDAAGPRATVTIQGYLSRPRGVGPFAALVVLHSCLGLPANRRAIGDMIARWNYVALFVDDFAPRGLAQTCAVDFGDGPADAYGALRYLSALPYVDPMRIGAVGFSQGGDTALKLASTRFAPNNSAFRAAAAFYPPCANVSGQTLAIPTLILVGEQDAVTPAADCEKLVAIQPDKGARIIVYPGARHGFDNPSYGGGKRVLGMALAYDRAAAAQSAAALRDFLGANLAQ